MKQEAVRQVVEEVEDHEHREHLDRVLPERARLEAQTEWQDEEVEEQASWRARLARSPSRPS